jgi:hypothetical protein
MQEEIVTETIKTYQGQDIGVSQCLVTLEGFIGDMDGKTVATEAADGFFNDEGTVDASDAVTAINGLIWSLEKRESEIAQLKERLKSADEEIKDLRRQGGEDWALMAADVR